MKKPWTGRGTKRTLAKAELVLELLRPQTTTDGRLDGEPKQASGAALRALDLSGADLRKAQLQRTDFCRAVLNDARFDGADLSWAVLDGAHLQNANFTGARLLETTFRNADLTGCDFTDVTGLSPSTVRHASSLRGVRWPEGFSPVERSVGGPLIHHAP